MNTMKWTGNRTENGGRVLPKLNENVMNNEALVVPTSFAQQRLWFLDQLEPGNHVYNMPRAISLTGPVCIASLERSFNEIVRRHESLRTTFSVAEGQPAQVISPLTHALAEGNLFKLSLSDLGYLSEIQRESEVRRVMTEEAQRPFDLEHGPLLRAALLRLDENVHVLLLTMHHIISDAWSLGVLFHELSVLYKSFSAGKPSPLPELSTQYADFAESQRELLQGDVLRDQLLFWKEQLEGAPSILDLPTDRPRPAAQTFRGSRKSLVIPGNLTAALKRLSMQEGVSLFMTLLAAFQTLLYRYTRQTDIVVGSPVANRNRVEVEDLIGFFVNTLVLRTKISDDLTFRELLNQVREVCSRAYANQDLPFEKLVEELQPERHLSLAPLFQVMFVLHNAPGKALELPGMTVRTLKVDNETAKFDLSLSMTEVGEELRGRLEYNVDLFDALTINRMAGHFEKLLEGIVADPVLPLSDIPLLTDAERRQLLFVWNQTQADYPKDLCLHKLVDAQVEKTPDAVAVISEDNHVTYDELNSRANQLANYLISCGVKPEDIVGVFLDRSLEMVIGMIGVMKSGGAYMPMDPKHPKDRLSYMLEETNCETLLTKGTLVPELPEGGFRIVCLDTHWKNIADCGRDDPGTRGDIQNLIYVMYTSGSTGRPKGVMAEHWGINNYVFWMKNTFRISSRDKVLFKENYCFDATVWLLFLPLLCGASIIVVPPDRHLEGQYLANLIVRERVTLVYFIPSMLPCFLDGSLFDPCATIEYVFCGGEALPIELMKRYYANGKPPLHNLYGPTEASIGTVWWRCNPQHERKAVPIGRPISNTQAYTLDRYLQPVPIGVAGELHLAGVCLIRGYLNHSDLTACSFIPNPFSSDLGTRLYKTGDVVSYLPDGNIEFLGRIDDQVKIRGQRIEMNEIEAALAEHPDVWETVVTVQEQVAGEKRLVAYVVLDTDKHLSISELRRFLKEKLPEYMVPSAFVFLDTLPLTPNGKLDRKALPEPDQSRPDMEAEFVPPSTQIEKALAGIWAEVLKLDRVGIHDNFFELGGNSLQAVQLASKISGLMNLDISVRYIFLNSSIARLADALENLPSVETVVTRMNKVD